MGGKSSSQTIGYKYFASVMTHLGSRIEKVLGVNFDKRKWIMNEDDSRVIFVDEPNLYGETEGGVQGEIVVYVGEPNQLPNAHYLEYDPLASGYPYDSYLILQNFYHGNTNTMREMLVWPKRTRVQNDGAEQWYKIREDGAVVCEIDARSDVTVVEPLSEFDVTVLTKVRTSQTIDDEDSRHITNNEEDLLLGIAYVSSFSGGTTLDYLSVEQTFTTTSPGNYTIRLPFRSRNRNAEITISTDEGYTLSRHEDGAAGDEYILITVSSNKPLYVNVLIRSAVEQGVGEIAIRGFTTMFVSDFVITQSSPSVDINPIHKIREILTNPSPWGMGKPEIDINEANFIKAADRIYDEGLGVSWAVNNKNCVDAINELCYHIEGGARINRQSGQYEIVLFRNDWFSSEEIHTLPESKIKSIKPESKSIEDIYNQVNVSFYNRDEIKNGAFSIADVGLIKTVGNVITSDVKFPYFMSFKNAEKVAQWKLKQLSTGTWSGSFTTGYKEARKWNRYDLLWLEWSRKWSSPILVRIMSIGLGTATNSTVTIEFEEVVQHSNMGGFVTFDPSKNTGVQPPQPNNSAVFEVPYYLLVMAVGQRVVDEELAYNSDYGIVGAIAEKPQNNSLYAILQTNDGTGWNERASTVDYVERAELASAVGRLDNVFYVSKLPSAVGELALIRDEWVVVESIDLPNSSITVKRGALDTIPVTHDATIEIFYSGTYFAFDAKEYQDGDEVLAYILTTTTSGIQEPAGVAEVVEMDSRAIRPYPPANVKFDGEYWKQEFAGDLVVTWSHRNRVQQTSSEPLGWYEPSVTLEEGVEYVVEYDELNSSDVILDTAVENVGAVDTHTILSADLDANTTKLAIRLYTVRDSYESMQKVEHTITLSDAFNAPYNLVGTYANNEVTLTWDFDE